MGSSTKKSKIWEKNLYDLLEIEISASESEIKKAYRKKALKCHPDKNPDNPRAAELFVELSSALEILTDEKAKEAYDRTLKAKELAKARTRELDVKRRKLKEDLERREQEAKESARTKVPSYQPDSSGDDEEQLRKEIERLKKEGSRALQEEQELIRQQILKEQQERGSFIHQVHVIDEAEKKKPKFKVKWSSGVAMDEENLKAIFGKYGCVSDIIVIKRSALLEFSRSADAIKAFEAESKKEDFKLNWITKPEEENSSLPNKPIPVQAPRPPMRPAGPPTASAFADFEAMILGKLSDAAKVQNLQESSS